MKTSMFSDKEKLEIRAAYSEGGITQRELAKKHNCALKTIQRVIAEVPKEEMRKLTEDVHEANVENMLEHIRKRSFQAMGLFDQILDTLQTKIENASARELFGGLKILSEVFAPQSQSGTGDASEAVKINVIFGDTSGADKPSEDPEQISAEEAQTYAE